MKVLNLLNSTGLSSSDTLIPNIPKPKFKRRYVTRISWLVSGILSIICFFAISNTFFSLYIVATLLSISTILNIMMFYVNPDYFSLDAYITIAIAYMLAFSKFIIIPLDIALTSTPNRTSAGLNSTDDAYSLTQFLWSFIYWVSMILNFVVMRFQLSYWYQGYPTWTKKAYMAIKKILIQIAILAGIGLIILVVVLIKYGIGAIDTLKVVLQLLNYCYCLLVIILLLGYGLVEFPFYFLHYTDSESKLKLLFAALINQKEEFETSVNKYLADKLVCVKACQQVLKAKGSYNESFAKSILSEVNSYKFDINDLVVFNKNIKGTLKEKKDIVDDDLSNYLITMKHHMYNCCKREAALLRIYKMIFANAETKTLEGDSDIDARERKVKDVFKVGIKTKDDSQADSNFAFRRKRTSVLNTKDTKNDSYKILYLAPRRYNLASKIFSKLFGLILLVVSAFVVIFQIIYAFIGEYNVLEKAFISINIFYVNYLIIIMYFSYLFICCYYSLSKFKLTEIYILVPHHTNKFSMAQNANICNTIILGIVYNLTYFFSQLYQKSKISPLTDFFLGMQKIDILYKNYVYIFPIALVVVITITFLRKMKLFCFKQSKGDFYQVEVGVSKEEKEIVAKAYGIIEKMELTYPEELGVSEEKKTKDKVEPSKTMTSEGEMKVAEDIEAQNNSGRLSKAVQHVKDSKPAVIVQTKLRKSFIMSKEGPLKLKQSLFKQKEIFAVLNNNKLIIYEDSAKTRIFDQINNDDITVFKATKNELKIESNSKKFTFFSLCEKDEQKQIDLFSWQDHFLR